MYHNGIEMEPNQDTLSIQIIQSVPEGSDQKRTAYSKKQTMCCSVFILTTARQTPVREIHFHHKQNYGFQIPKAKKSCLNTGCLYQIINKYQLS